MQAIAARTLWVKVIPINASHAAELTTRGG